MDLAGIMRAGSCGRLALWAVGARSCTIEALTVCVNEMEILDVTSQLLSLTTK